MAKRKQKLPALSQQVRQAIDDCGMSRYRIWKLTGIDQTALSRFMSGERGLSSTSLDTIGELLELQIVSPKRPRK